MPQYSCLKLTILLESLPRQQEKRRLYSCNSTSGHTCPLKPDYPTSISGNQHSQKLVVPGSFRNSVLQWNVVCAGFADHLQGLGWKPGILPEIRVFQDASDNLRVLLRRGNDIRSLLTSIIGESVERYLQMLLEHKEWSLRKINRKIPAAVMNPVNRIMQSLRYSFPVQGW